MNKLKLLVLSAAAIVPAAAMLTASALGPNLISNDKFTTNANGWDDFGGNPVAVNGHLKVKNTYTGTGNSYYGAWTCVSGIEAGKSYTASVQTFVSKQAPLNTGASFQLHYYAGNNCDGGGVSGGTYKETGKADADRGHWVSMSFSQVVPATAKSVRVRVSAIKEPLPSGSAITKTTTVYFDNAFYGRTTVIKPGLEGPNVLVNPTQKPPTPTPTPGILVNPTVNPPTPTPTPGILVNPTVNPPTPTPTPGILVNPTSTPTPPDDPQDEPGDQPQDDPQDEPTDDPQDEPTDEPLDEPQDNPQTNDDGDTDDQPVPGTDNGGDTPNQGAPGGTGDNPTVPPSAPDTGNTGGSGLVTPTTGLGMMLMAFGFGGGALALAFALRKRRDEDDE